MRIFATVRPLVCAAAFALLAAGAGPAAAQDKALVMKLSTATLNDAQHEWMKRFAVAIEKNTGGRIKAEVYPASQLGTIPRQIEGTQLGSIQAWVGPPEFLVGVDARYELEQAGRELTDRQSAHRDQDADHDPDHRIPDRYQLRRQRLGPYRGPSRHQDQGDR